jgi:hypothetical protein
MRIGLMYRFQANLAEIRHLAIAGKGIAVFPIVGKSARPCTEALF